MHIRIYRLIQSYIDILSYIFFLNSLPSTEPVFVNVYGAQESIPRIRFLQVENRFLGSLKCLQYKPSRFASFTLIHIFKPIHSNIDTPVQAYIYRLIQSYIDTHLAEKIHFVPTFLADCSRIDSYTQIHVFKPIHRQIDTPVYKHIGTVLIG
jgi:hypothetical protein